LLALAALARQMHEACDPGNIRDWPTYLKPKQAKLAMTAAMLSEIHTSVYLQCSDLQLQFQGPVVVLISSSSSAGVEHRSAAEWRAARG
jgi:hypothetical protein